MRDDRASDFLTCGAVGDLRFAGKAPRMVGFLYIQLIDGFSMASYMGENG